MTLKTAVAGIAALELLFGSGAVQAHARLVSADPAVGATVKISPRALRATFSEAVVGQFSALELTTDKGAPVTIGKAVVNPRDHHMLMAPIGRPLAAGSYIVQWRSVGADTHRMTGHYGFRILP